MTPAEVHPILVTGAHRTGTTWVGRGLAAGPRLAYISEPLNLHHRPGVLSAHVAHWYEYICRENEAEFLPAFHELLAFRYHAASELGSLRTARDALRMGRDFSIFMGGGLRRKRPLLKDPFAVFSLDWFAERLHCEIVVTVRHPAAFAGGLKRLAWRFDFQNLLQQPLLMSDHLEPYRAMMLSEAADDVVGQASLLWIMVYQTLETLRERGRSIRVVRHEDLSLNPGEGFRQLYGALGLDYTPGIERRILDSTSSENPGELSQRRVHSVKLDSRANLNNWRHRLSQEEISRIRRITEDVCRKYYPEESWS